MELPEEPPPTPRNVVKYMVRTFVSIKATSMSKDAIIRRTSYEKDNIPLRLVTGVIGWYVSYKLTPLTDKMVDLTADFIVAKRDQWKAWKAKKKETEDEK